MSKEQKEDKELNALRKTFFAQKINCVGIEVFTKTDKTQVLLKTDTDLEITYNLKKQTSKRVFNEALGIYVTDEQVERVDKNELSEHFPEIFKKIATYLKKEPVIELYVSYSQSALRFPDGIKTYKFFRDSQVSTIYAKVIHNDDERLEKQMEASKKAEERRKGEQVEVPTETKGEEIKEEEIKTEEVKENE